MRADGLEFCCEIRDSAKPFDPLGHVYEQAVDAIKLAGPPEQHPEGRRALAVLRQLVQGSLEAAPRRAEAAPSPVDLTEEHVGRAETRVTLLVLERVALRERKLPALELGSRALEFRPGPLRGAELEFAVGSAGSAMLVLQTVIPPLLRAGRASLQHTTSFL